MTPICTPSEVFDFMGTGTQERDSSNSLITGLIDRVAYGIEQFIGRKISENSFTIKIHDGRYCSINGEFIFLSGMYYDLVKITSLKENGTALTENTHFFFQKPNILERIDGFWDATKQGNIEITGVCGLVYDTGSDVTPIWTPSPDLKQIVIEAVAIKSGLWAKSIDDGEGNKYQVIRQNLPKVTIDSLQGYKIPVM